MVHMQIKCGKGNGIKGYFPHSFSGGIKNEKNVQEYKK